MRHHPLFSPSPPTPTPYPQVLEKSVSPETAMVYAEMIPPLITMARMCIRDMEPQNDLTFIRIRSRENEIIVAPYEEFHLVVVQGVSTEDT